MKNSLVFLEASNAYESCRLKFGCMTRFVLENMMAEHTPGPWFIAGDEIHDRQTFFDETGARVGDTPNSICEMHLVPFGKMKANQALIKASPRLLAALTALVEHVDSDWFVAYGDSDIRRAAIEAIKEATTVEKQ